MARSASSVQAEFTAPTQHMREAPGVWIGRYRLIELIGEGGFGTVWRAEQHDPVRREVALKVVKPGMDSAPILARFAAERQALTRMEHPHIATLLDAGQTGNGRPFFAMTLVHGHPITRYCDDRQLGIRRRLELFTAVCEAVEHAHRRGILHRDLKPSNILVEEIDGAAMPRVIDFGIAKVLGAVDDEASADALTQRGAAIGTPQYMSPEQAASTPDVDTRSDVYALGAVLYEMLTGSPPIEREQIKSRSWEEILRLVREADVPRPSDRLAAPTEDAETRAARRQTTGRRLVDSIRGELDWIVLKALEKDRERRYASAAHLAEDIRRHLSGAPVSAGPPSGVYRIKKFLRRHWLPVSAAAAIAIVLAAGIAVSTWQWRQARQSDLASRASLHQLQRVEIDDAMRRGDFARVERLVAEARASGFPDSDFLLFNELEAREGRNDPSVVQLIESLDVTRLDASLRPRLDYWKADRLLRAGRLEEGSALMQNALNAGLPPLEAALARGTLSTSVQEALDHFQQAVELAPMRSVAQRNLALALGLAGRMEEARHRILLGQSLFPDEQNYFALEALMAAFQNQPEAAMQAAARIPDPAARQAFEALVDQVSTFSNALLLALCGNNPVSLLDKLKVGTAVMRFQALGGQDAPFGLSGMAPVLIRGLTGLMQGLIANFQSPGGEQGIQAIERALKSNDEGTLWAVLGVMHFSRDEYDRAIEAFLKAQNTPALLPHIRHAARLMEGAAEAGTWMRTMDAATLQRAESALRDAYESDLPDRAFEAIFGLAHSLALTVKDRSLARRIAQRLPRDSPKQLDFVTKIEYAEGNRTKALAQARRAVELHPTDEALQRLVASIEAGTLSGFETYAPKP